MYHLPHSPHIIVCSRFFVFPNYLGDDIIIHYKAAGPCRVAYIHMLSKVRITVGLTHVPDTDKLKHNCILQIHKWSIFGAPNHCDKNNWQLFQLQVLTRTCTLVRSDML